MDSSTIIIAAILIAISVIPFLGSYLSARKKKKYFVQELNTMASCYDSKITKQEVFNNMTFGYDASNDNLFFIKKGKKSGQVKFMPLSAYSRCELYRQDDTKGDDRGEKIPELLCIRFFPRTSENKVVDIEIYNAAEDYRLSGEREFGEQWVTTINKICNS